MSNSTLSTTPLCVENANVNATVFINGRSFTIAAHDDSGVMFSNAWAPSWKELKAVNALLEVDPHAEVTLEPHNDTHLVDTPESVDLPRVAYECTKHHHAKKNFDYWLLHLPQSADKLESADFSRIRAEVESRGGWYSRKFGRIPGGFAFKVAADALRMQADLADSPILGMSGVEYINGPFSKDSQAESVDVSGHVLVPYPHTDLNQADPWADKYKVDSRDFDGSQRYFISVLCNRRWGYLHQDGIVRDNAYHNHQPLGWFDTSDEAYLVLAEYLNGPNPQDSTTTGNAKLASKLRDLLDKVERDIRDLRNSIDHAQTNTHKRRGEQATRRNKLFHLERVATALDKLQDLHDRSAVSSELATFTTKKAIVESLTTGCDRDSNGLHVDTFEFTKSDAASKALQTLVGNDNAANESELVKAEQDSWLANCQIDGFFPTPTEIAESLVMSARIDGHMNVLEPSAGNGAIADVINQRHKFATVHCVESNHQLAEICGRRTDSRHTHCADFMDWNIQPIGAQVGYQRVVMNPPFERNQWRDHVMHAIELLADGGRLVALLPNVAQRCDKFEAMLREANLAYEFTDMGQPFQNGLRPTGVNCVMCVVDKGEPTETNPRIVVKSIPTPQAKPSWSTGIAVVHGNGTAVVTSNSTELATTDETESADDTPEPEQRRALFTIDRASLTKALTRLTDTSPGNGFKTVLKSVRVSVNGTTTLSASDLERYHDETLQADHDGDFDILVDAKRFKQAVAKSRKDTLQVELWDRSLRVAGTTLPSTAEVDEFPHVDSLQSATHDTIAIWRGSASELASMLERTIYATDSDSSRYALGGCLIEFDRDTDDALQIIGTDGRRLAVSRHGKSTIDADSVESCIIAAAHLKGACKALKSADDAVLSLTSDATQCNVEYVQDHKSRLTAKITTPTVTRLTTIGACGESSYVFRQVDGRFPKWRDVLPKVDTLCEVDAKALFGFATAMESATTDESRGADLTIVGNQLTATLKSDCGEFSDTLSVRGCGCDDFTATLDARFVLDFAKSVQRCGESIRIGGTDADSPMILQADNVACVIMPLARDKARK